LNVLLNSAENLSVLKLSPVKDATGIQGMVFIGMV